jgi:hypothetical protein
MPREKIRRTDKVTPVDMGIVKELKAHRLKRNSELDGTGKFCNLYPDINKQVCKECSNNVLCLKHSKEREYIHEQEATKGNQRRKRKQDNPKYHEEKPTDVSEKYPCGEFYFACPKKAECNFGKTCEYKTD